MTTSRNFLTTTTKRAKRNTLLALLFVLGVLTCACDGATKGNGLGAKVSKTEPARHSARRSQNLTSAANLGGGGALKGNGLGTKVARTKRPRHSAHRSENLTSSSDLGWISTSDFVDAVTDLYASIVAYYDEWKTSSSSSSSTTSEMTIDFGESADMCEERAAADWEDEESSQIECTTCGSIGSLLGGYQVLGTGSYVSKAFSDLPTHSIVTINLDFVQIDSWDNERFYVYADNDLVYTSHTISKSTGTQECGSSLNNWNEFVIPASFTFAHSSSSLTLKITTNLNSEPSDESWGIQKVHLKLASDYTTSLERLKYCPDVTTNWAVRYDLSPTCDNGIDLSAYTSGLDVDEAIAKCAECSGCTAVSYKDSDNILYTSGCSGGSGCLTGWSDWSTYRDFEYCDALSTNNFQTHVDGCLEESPVDGMCYTYGRNNNIGPMSHWDVSEVTSMNQAFYGKSSFNTDLSNWDVSKVTDMYRMFRNTNFQQWLINWDVSLVTDMREMFYGAAYFAGFVGNWRSESTSLLTTDMFSGATTFNAKYSSCGDDGPPSSCRVPLTDSTFSDAVSNCLAESATTGECTTYGASSDFGVMSDWDVSGVTNMPEAFKGKGTFNADLSKWDVSSVENMESMFHWANTFDQNIGHWNVAKVKNMKSMFDNAQAFTQNIGSWNVASVEDMERMFYGASSFNADISSWDVASVENMYRMFYDATAFNQDISDWSVSASATTTDMFTGSAFATSRSDLAVTVSNDGATTSDEEFALGVSVSATACTTDSSCDLSEGGTSTDDVRAEGGLYCVVTVKTTSSQTCSSPSTSGTIACMSWPNFYNHDKASAYRYALTTTDSSGGGVIAGDYTVSYACEWKFKGDNTAPGASMNIVTVQGTAEFTVSQGCSDTLPTALSTISLPDLFVLSVPEFLAITDGDDCDNVETILETAFRKYDTNPLDGTLDANEWEKAFLQHDVSTRYVKSNYDGQSFTLSQVINSAMLPLVCAQNTHGHTSADVYFDSITYPDKYTDVDSSSTQLNSCKDATEKLTVKLGFGTPPTTSDAVCVYSDGYLFKDYESKDFSTSPTELIFEDKRPSMRTGDDAIELVGHFTFDDIGDIDTSKYETAGCDPGGQCLKTTASSTGYAWNPVDDSDGSAISIGGESAIMTWIYFASSRNQDDKIYYSEVFTSSGSSCTRKVYFTVTSSYILKAGYDECGVTSEVSYTLNVNEKSQDWHHVAMISEYNKLAVYFDGAEKANVGSSTWSGHKLEQEGLDVAGKTLFNSPYGSDYVYDDFRAYTGVLTALHVQSIYELGREVRSANLAEAKPQSRRTFCVIAKYGGDQSAYTPCATGLFYNGLVIDLLTSIETTGVVFQFRDTALDEIGYEVLRRKSGSTSSYDVVLFIDSGMSGCSYTYNMLSFYDADAAKEPGVTWEYAIRTKYDATTSSDVISDAYTYVVPWYGTVDGTVVAGDTEVPVADVRVCARLDSSTTSATDLLELGSKVTSSASSYMAKNRYVTHSAKTLSAFEATDGETDTSVTVDHGEHLKVNLDVFASVTEIKVSFSTTSTPLSSSIVARVLDFDDPDDNGDRGLRCISSSLTSTSTNAYEQTYSCVGTHVTAFPGQYVTILNDLERIEIFEIAVTGEELACPYYGFSDDDGNFEIEIHEATGVSQKKTKVAVRAFKTDVFDPEDVSVFTPMEEGSNDSVTIKSPEAVLIALEYFNTAKYDHCMSAVDRRRAYSDYTGITCNGATSMTTSSKDPTECFQTCSECSECVSFNYDTSTGVCTWASSGSWGDSYWDSSYEWYRSCDSGGIKTSDFATHVAGCLAEAPIDGLCKEYSGKSFSGYTDNYIGMMPYWDVSKVTDMSEAFKDKDTFNADLSSWDVSSVTNMDDMFYGASSFNQDISGWNVDSSAVTTTSMFSGATAFQERFTCTSLLDGPPNSCTPAEFVDAADDDDDSSLVSKEEFAAYAQTRMEYSDAFVILPDDVWNSFDENGDKSLNVTEFMSAVSAFDNGEIKGTPWLVYSLQETEDLTGFYVYPSTSVSIDFGESEDQCNQYAADGWTDENGATVACTTCGSFGSLLGGYNTLAKDSSVQKAFTDLSAHTDVTVLLDFVQIDSWDNEIFYVYADDVLVYTSNTLATADGSTNVCGASSESSWKDNINSVSFTFAHTSSSLTLKITTNLNSAGTDESWGIQKIDLYLNAEYLAIALAPNADTTMPISNTLWQTWYENMTATFSSFSLASPDSSAGDDGGPVTMGVTDAPETASAFIPLVARTSANAVQIVFNKDAESTKTSGFDALLSTYFPSTAANLTVRATEQIDDVVHVFEVTDQGNDTPQSEKKYPIKHLGNAGDEIKDNTVVTVSGIVRFPGSRTQDVVCGLPYATIKAYKKICSLKGECEYEEATEYTADSLGYFQVSVTPGESVLFAASYDTHDLCYAGTSLEDECDEAGDALTLSLSSSTTEDVSAYVELDAIVGGEYMVFYDFTARTVDVGLYAGACGTSYSNYEMLITPANGCGAAVTVSDTDINGWTREDASDSTSNVRYWPYAAMDYYIQLDDAPTLEDMDASSFDADKQDATCTAAGSDILSYFRDRDLLVRTLGFLESESETAQYQFHGMLCALPTISDYSDFSSSNTFASIADGETCIEDSNGNATTLELYHLIGSDSSLDVSENKYVTLEIFEAHSTDTNTIEYCSTFSSTSNADLSVSIQVTNDVLTEDPCHSTKVASSECYLDTVDADTGYVQFGESTTTNTDDSTTKTATMYYEITSTDAKPNLVKPYRRTVAFKVVRDDGWSSTTTSVDRELVTLRSKVRGESSEYASRYVSQTTFFATAPIRGLVYSVVHDPPGGNSYASIAKGTAVNTVVELNKAYSGSVGEGWSTNGGWGASMDVKTNSEAMISGFGPIIGGAIEIDTGNQLRRRLLGIASRIEAGFNSFANSAVGRAAKAAGARRMGVAATPGGGNAAKTTTIGFSAGIEGGDEESGPSVSVSTSEGDGWSLDMTLDRNMESSQDPGIPGRPGDVILGGGFEIVYVRTDTLGVNTTGCLTITEQITWYPRQPTSYFVNVFTVEDKIIPELEDLKETLGDASDAVDQELADEGFSDDAIKEIWTHRLSTAISDWENTLAWASPDFNPASATNETLKATAYDDAETELQSSPYVPMTSSESVFSTAFTAQDTQIDPDEFDNDLKDNAWGDALESVWNDLPDKLSNYGMLHEFENNHSIFSHEKERKNFEDLINISKPESEDWLSSTNPLHDTTFSGTKATVLKSANEENSIFSRGMSAEATSAATKDGAIFGIDGNDANYNSYGTTELLDASVYGHEGRFTFGSSDSDSFTATDGTTTYTDPFGTPMFGTSDTKSNIRLTFTGGGHALEFSTSISQEIDGASWGWALSVSDEKSHSTSANAGIAAFSIGAGNSVSQGEGIDIDRLFAWSKFGVMETSYSLGDPDHGDKFVVQIRYDNRFGTPIFQTIGGATKCPGEPNTMWRENGVSITNVMAASGVDALHIPPHSDALFDIVIQNETPYRESAAFGLVVVADDAYSGDVGGNANDLTFKVNGNTLPAFGGMYTLNDIPSVDDSDALVQSVMTLRVTKGADSHSYSHLSVELVSECEFNIGSLYRDPISSTAALDGTGTITWERVCPPVTWSETTWNNYADYTVSSTSSEYFNVTVTNPDPMNLWSADAIDDDTSGTNHLVHPNVEYVRIQFRRPGVGEWINAWEPGTWNDVDSGATDDDGNTIYTKVWTAFDPDSDVLAASSDIFTYDIEDVDLASCSTSRGAGCSQKWNLNRQYFLNGLKEGPWEIRAKVFCSGYDSFATSEVRGSVTDENLNLIADVTNPKPIGKEVFDYTVLLDFSEPITCPQLSSLDMAYTVARTSDCDGAAVSDATSAINEVSDEYLLSHYEFRCLTDNANGRNAWMMTVPISTSVSTYAYAGEYEVTIKSDKIEDDGGNFASEYSFTEKIGCDTSSTTSAALGRTTAEKVVSNVTRASLGAKRALSHQLGSVISRGDKSALIVALSAYALALSILCAFLLMKPTAKAKDAIRTPTSTIETYDETEVLERLQSDKSFKNNYGTSHCEVL